MTTRVHDCARIFSALFKKEWRDHRSLLVVAAVCGPLLAWGAQSLPGVVVADDIVGASILPGLAGLLLAALAADAVAGEIPRGVGRALSRLPVSPRAFLATKVVFLAAAWVCFQAWLLGVESARRALVGHDVHLVVGSCLEAIEVHWLVAITAASALAFGAALQRGMHAAIAGVLFVGGPIGLVRASGEDALRSRVDLAIELAGPGVVAVFSVSAFVVAAFVAYSPRPDGRSSWIRGLLGALGFGVIAGPFALVAGVAAARDLDIVPYADDVEVRTVSPSPDGRWVALEVMRERRIRGVLGETWLLDVENDDVFELNGVLIRDGFGPHRGWDDEGRVTCMVEEPVVQKIDPETRSVVEEESAADYFESWMQCRRQRPYDAGRRLYAVSWPATGRVVQIEADRYPTALPEPGVFLYAGASGTIFRRSFEAEEPVAITRYDGSPPYLIVSPGGRTVALTDASGVRLLDTSDGSLVAGPFTDFWFQQWSDREGEVCVLHSRRRRSGTKLDVDHNILRHVRGDGWTDVRIGDGLREYDARPIASGGYVANTGSTVELIDGRGVWVRTLYAPASTAR